MAPWLRSVAFCNQRTAQTTVALASVVACLALLPARLPAQTQPIVLPAGTPLSVSLLQHAPMKAGEPLQGKLLYPVFVDNRLVVPAGALLYGRVVRLTPDRSRRIKARLRGDFTPFHTPVVTFTQLVGPDGMPDSFHSSDASDGLSLLKLSPPPARRHRSWIASQLAEQKQRLRAQAALFTAPGKADRLLQFIYTQLPYHPERIESNTAWTVAVTEPLTLDSASIVPGDPADKFQKPQQPGSEPGAAPKHEPQPWQIRAYLQQSISSADQKTGNRFDAVVAEPVFRADHSLAVPQGSVLVGEITQAKPARSFGRAGKLRFRFRELRLPAETPEPVEGALNSIDAGQSADLKMDVEGGIAPQSQNRAIVPLALGILAGHALDDDGNKVFNNAIASNGFGIVGRLVGILANSKNVAAGIGFYAAGLSIYDLWVARGHNVAFARNTRIEVTTTQGRNPVPKSGPR